MLRERAGDLLSLLAPQGRMLCLGGTELPGSLLPGLGRGGTGVEQRAQSASSRAVIQPKLR